MSDTADTDWGDMVAPGVYIIQRSQKNADLSSIVERSGSVNLELVHLEIEEVQRHIDMLQKNNIEMAELIKELRSSSIATDNQDSGKSNKKAALCNGEIADEGDEELLLDAIAENKDVIALKQRELDHLNKLIKGQRCGCSCSHKSGAVAESTDPTPVREVTETESVTQITL